jgi:uncharacterized protein YgiM (DUF1202 family)
MGRTLRRERWRSEAGRAAEYLVILVVILVLGGAFAYAYTRPDDKHSADATTSTTASSATPPTLPPPRTYRVTEDVNVRGAPTTSSAVVAQIQSGKSVIVMCRIQGQSVTAPDGSTDQWVRIALFGGAAGYVSAVYVETGGDIDDRSVIGVCGPA